jgi:hypothetical protein
MANSSATIKRLRVGSLPVLGQASRQQAGFRLDNGL